MSWPFGNGMNQKNNLFPIRVQDVFLEIGWDGQSIMEILVKGTEPLGSSLQSLEIYLIKLIFILLIFEAIFLANIKASI